MRKVIRLTESDLHRIVKESVKKIIKESGHEWWREEDWNPNYPGDDDEDYGEPTWMDKSKEWIEDHIDDEDFDDLFV